MHNAMQFPASQELFRTAATGAGERDTARDHTQKNPAVAGGARCTGCSAKDQKLTVVVLLAVTAAVCATENARLVAPAVSAAAQVTANV